ncbi:DNA recombination protein RmuC [Salinimonas marina]|nr:DNA recombination protein RmuC [Salinimonas marina]
MEQIQTWMIAALVGAALSGILAGSLWQRRQSRTQLHQLQQQLTLLEQRSAYTNEQLQHQLEDSQDAANRYQEQLYTVQTTLGELNQKAAQLTRLEGDHQSALERLEQLHSDYAALNAKYQAQSASFSETQKNKEEQLQTMQNAEQRLQTQFENLANKIFSEKSESFSRQSQQNLDSLLTPLKEQIDGFKRQVNEQYSREGQERASLKTEILSLKELNQQITQEAAALTMALKGDNKKQGNWGEVVLERILKESGLREGHEFETQVSARSRAGKLQQPDVVVHLPDDKDVIIDSKVSLSAYEKYFNSDDASSQEYWLKEHVNSIRGHIKGLGAKDYQELDALRTLDYVLLFIPIEPAFLLAIEKDPELVSMALNHNIMLVSPTNLLVALRTINNIWQYEYQNQNAQKIAEKAARLYDKFAGFVQDMDKLGKSLETSQKHFDGAFNKLSSGRGNLVRQVEQFRDLGVQPSKRLPEPLTRRAGIEGSHADAGAEHEPESSLPNQQDKNYG